MEYIIALLVGALGVLGFLFTRKKGLASKVIKFEKKDAALKALQEEKEDDIAALNKRLKKISEKAKSLTPKEVEDFWNEEDS
jgi:hypothetical protein